MISRGLADWRYLHTSCTFGKLACLLVVFHCRLRLGAEAGRGRVALDDDAEKEQIIRLAEEVRPPCQEHHHRSHPLAFLSW